MGILEEIKDRYMKKLMATILSAAVFSLALTSCKFGGGYTPKGSDEGDPTSSSSYETLGLPYGTPSHDLTKVDVTATFDDFVFEYDKPWGADKNLRMAKGDVDNYFVYVALDSRQNMVNENLNTISTVTKPNIKAYRDANQPGYVIYEVTYDQIFPIYTREPASVYTSFFSYHNVEFVDFYTGTKIPSVFLSTSINSFGVTGNVFRNGKKYVFKYYEFRSSEPLGSSTKTDGSSVILNQKIVIHSTSYFIVPEEYDGLLMCVYVANDTNRPLKELLEENNPDFYPPEPFGDDENPDDYVFFGITAPK